MTNEVFNSRANSLAVQEAQKALRLFWDETHKKYAERNSLDLDEKDRLRLAEIERHLFEALRLVAEKNVQT